VFGRAHAEALIARWQEKWSRATVYQYRRELLHLAKFIGQQTRRETTGLVPRVRRPSPRETIATPEEIERLKAVSKAWMRLYILIATTTALRRGDILRLSQAHIAADEHAGPVLRLRQQKTDRILTLPLAPQLQEAIAALPPGETEATPFLERAAGKPVTVAMFGHEWKQLRKKAIVRPELTSHDLRRTVAVSLYEISKDLRTVQQMLGHTSLSSTVIYLEHKDPEKLKPLLQQLWTSKGPVQ